MTALTGICGSVSQLAFGTGQVASLRGCGVVKLNARSFVQYLPCLLSASVRWFVARCGNTRRIGLRR